MNKLIKSSLQCLVVSMLVDVCVANNANGAIQSDKEYSLSFDKKNYTKQSISVNGHAFEYRAFEGVVYVKHPVDIKYQQMNVYIPEAYFEGKTIGQLDAQTAPIFMPNNIGAYMPAEPGKLGMSRDGTSPNAATIALSKGYVVAFPGVRGRTNKNENGLYTGKAPAAIVDLKAAVRYLRYNDKIMPGDAEKIISNGTSAGGAISALLGASGNRKEYFPYLKAIGAADTRDDIFAVSAYCPITDLEHADAAYEWQFNGVTHYKKMVFGAMIDFHMQRKEVEGQLTEDEVKTSNMLKTIFPSYVNALNLKDEQGRLLKLDKDGNGNFKDYVKSQVMASAQQALGQGLDLSQEKWLRIEGARVIDMDFDAYTLAILRMKTPPAFDALNLSSGENDLFATSTGEARHFTLYSQTHATKPSQTADLNIIKMMNPMTFIGDKTGSVANHWRIRHGTIDRDTSLAVSAILTAKLRNSGKTVDYALPWARPHSGDYDLEDLFSWVESITQVAK